MSELKTPHSSHNDDPLLPDQIVALEAERVQHVYPTPIVAPPPKQRFVVSSLSRVSAEPRLKRVSDVPGAYFIDEEAEFVEGLLGREAVRLPYDGPKDAAETTAPPHRRGDMEHSYLPRMSPKKTKTFLRSVRGSLIEPENIYGDRDDRVEFYPLGYPWHCAGQVSSWNNPSNTLPSGFGSGVLIGPRHVLTAGHLVPWDSDPWKMLFVAGSYDRRSVPQRSSYVTAVYGWRESFDSLRVDAKDFVVLVLFDRIGDDLGYFGAKVYDRRWQDQPYWYHIGYPGAIAGGNRPGWQGPFAVLRDDPVGSFLEIEHRADTTDGDSGGPLWSTWPDGFPYAIGAHSGNDFFNKDFNAAAGGRAMVDLVLAMRDQFK